MENMVIGIEGLVGAGKSSICEKLLDIIPGSVVLNGGDIYRAIVFSIMQAGIDIKEIKDKLSNVNVKDIMDRLKLEIKIEDRQSVVYINGKKVNREDIQSAKSSLAVSIASKVADNKELYQFGKQLIDQFKEKYNVILSSRDIMRMYPEVDYHLLIVASLEERVKRKYNQYKGSIDIKELEESIRKRDELQEKSGYYDEFDKTIKIDVTDCKTVEESAKKVLSYIKLPMEV